MLNFRKSNYKNVNKFLRKMAKILKNDINKHEKSLNLE